MALEGQKLKIYIGEKETKWLLIIIFTSHFFVSSLTEFIVLFKNAAYIGVILSALCALLFFEITNKINYHMKYDLINMMKKCYGKTITTVLGTVIVALSVVNVSDLMRTFADAIGNVMLKTSPLAYILLFFAIASAASSLLGIKTLTQYAYIVGGAVTLMLFVIFLMNIKQYDVGNLALNFSKSDKVPKPSMPYMFSDIIYLFCISDLFKSGRAVIRVGRRAIIISGAAAALIAFFYCAAVPYPASLTFKYPFLRLASVADASIIFKRLEGLVYIIWIFSGFVSVGALSAFSLNIFSKVFNTSDTFGSLPVMIFIITAAAYMGFCSVKIFNFMFWILSFVLPIVTAMVYEKKLGKDEYNET